MGIHDGHRARRKEKFLEYGLDTFNEIEALEFLLFFAIPRKDTNELAHRLLEHYGCFHQVFHSGFEELLTVEGMTAGAAQLITLIPQLNRKIAIDENRDVRYIECKEDAAEYLIPFYKNVDVEVLRILCLDSNRRIICCKEVQKGTVNAVDACVKRLVDIAMKTNAASVIIAHNHPGGYPLPSHEDENITGLLFKALHFVSIKLEDHIIISDDTYVSLASTPAFRLFKF